MDKPWWVLLTGFAVILLLGIKLAFGSAFVGRLPHLFRRIVVLVRGSSLLSPSFLRLPNVMNKITLDMWPAFKDLGFGEAAIAVCLISTVWTFASAMSDARTNAAAWGWVNIVLLAMVVMPVTRHSIVLYIFGVPFERALRWHRVIGRLSALSQLVHLIQVVKGLNRGTEDSYWDSFEDALDWDSGGVVGKYGFAAFVTTIGIGFTAVEPLRRNFFEVFYFAHMAFVPLVYIFSFLHIAKTNARIILLVPVLSFGVEVLYRIVMVLVRGAWMKSAKVTALGKLGTKIEVTMPLIHTFEAGQYCWINIPHVSLFQWHPFSISSSPPGPGQATDGVSLTFHVGDIHGAGTFVNKLRLATTAYSELKVNIDGPYGRVALPLEIHGTILMFAGGMGITPMVSIFGDLLRRHTSGKLKNLHKCVIVFSSRHLDQLNWFQSIFEAANSAATGVFTAECYWTRAKPGLNLPPHIFPGRPKAESIMAKYAPTAKDSSASVASRDRKHSYIEVRTISSTASHLANSLDSPLLGNDLGASLLEDSPQICDDANKELVRPTQTVQNSRVAVLACGPPALVGSVQALAHQHSFNFHKETFLF